MVGKEFPCQEGSDLNLERPMGSDLDLGMERIGTFSPKFSEDSPKFSLVSNLDSKQPHKHSKDQLMHFPSENKSPRLSLHSIRRTSVSLLHNYFTIVDKIKERIPRVIQLFILVMCLGLLGMAGGMLFYMTERSVEEESIIRKRAIWDEIVNYGNFTDEEIENDVRVWADHYSNVFYEKNKWDLKYAAFFAVTTFTTIGFGFQAPKTPAGRAMVIIYGLPSIMIYGVLAKKIGFHTLHYLKKTFLLCRIPKDKFEKYRTSLIAPTIMGLFALLAWFIAHTATDEGFGNGIYTYLDGLYYLVTTTATIGYGDMMMSGAAGSVVNAMVGIWIVTTFGLVLAFSQELCSSTDRILPETSSANSSVIHLQNPVKSGKKAVEL